MCPRKRDAVIGTYRFLLRAEETEFGDGNFCLLASLGIGT